MTTPGGDRGKAVGRGRATTNAHVDAATRDLLDAYQRAWPMVRAQLEQAAHEAAAKAAASGNVADPALYRRAARLQAALSALEQAERRLANRHAAIIGPRVAPVVAIPAGVLDRIFHAEGLGAVLGRPSPDALEHIVTRTTQRIEALSAPLPEEARTVVHEKLLTGVAAGQHPEKVARSILSNARDAFGGQLTRALVISRTELLDASREATRRSFAASTQVVGWVWQANVGGRTCPACLAMSGTQHPVSETLEGHPQCRCVMVPLLRGETVADTGVLNGDQLIDRMSPEERLQSLGVTRLQLLADGQPVRSFATRQTNPGWRASHQVTPLSDLPKVDRSQGPGSAPPPPSPNPAAKSTTTSSSPAGTAPVSKAVKVSTRASDVVGAIGHATKVIDSVHTDGLLDDLPFRALPGGGGTLGAYTRGRGPHGAGVKIELQPGRAGLALTAVHEIGHWIDHQAMGRTKGTFGSEAPQTAEWKAVRAAMEASKAITGLRDLRTRIPTLGLKPNLEKVLDDHLEYLLRPREQWARAYSQWIAGTSGDHRLLADVARIVADQTAAGKRSGLTMEGQWADADFTGITAAIDVLMDKLGWRTNP